MTHDKVRVESESSVKDYLCEGLVEVIYIACAVLCPWQRPKQLAASGFL